MVLLEQKMNLFQLKHLVKCLMDFQVRLKN